MSNDDFIQNPTPTQAAEAATSSGSAAQKIGLDWRAQDSAPTVETATDSDLDKLLRARASIISELADRAGDIAGDPHVVGDVGSLGKALAGVELAISRITKPAHAEPDLSRPEVSFVSSYGPSPVEHRKPFLMRI